MFVPYVSPLNSSTFFTATSDLNTIKQSKELTEEDLSFILFK